jgi:hypothetical protein
MHQLNKFIGKRVEVLYNNYGTDVRFCDTLERISKRFLVFSSGYKTKLEDVKNIKEDPWGYLTPKKVI